MSSGLIGSACSSFVRGLAMIRSITSGSIGTVIVSPRLLSPIAWLMRMVSPTAICNAVAASNPGAMNCR